MAMAIKCDRCGRCVTDYCYCFDVVKSNIKQATRSSYSPLYCDLCPDCVEYFKKFMNREHYI